MKHARQGVRRALSRLNRRGRQSAAVPTVRFTMTLPETDDKRLQKMAAEFDATRHALVSALVLFALDILEEENADAVRMV